MKLLAFHNGAVTFRPERPAVPPSEKTEGNVTVRNAGNPGTPAHFTVSHLIEVAVEKNGVEQINHFHLTNIVVPERPTDSRHIQVEDAAARQIPEALRQLADQIEADIERAESATQRRREQHKE